MDNVEIVTTIPSNTKTEWQAFLIDQEIHVVQESVAALDCTVILRDNDGKIVGTGSRRGDILQYVAVCNKGQTPGARFNQVVSILLNDLAAQQIFHAFVFTKPKYRNSFEHIGFNLLAESELGVLLERGQPDIKTYLNGLPHVNEQQIASIVMNANPFTKGHQYLVTQAAEANDVVYVFVVNQDASLFTTSERKALVEAGTHHLSNVIVVDGGSYMVSYATFPAYFVKDEADVIGYQTTLDARLFKKWVAKDLHITRRYLGSEPYSKTTSIYNETLQRELEPKIEVIVVPRLELDNQAISATQVRQAIQAGDLATLMPRVPETTGQFIKNHLQELQDRIKKGQKINGN